MATQAHCAYCFESLVASLEKRPALSLAQVEALWAKYKAESTRTSELVEEPAEGAASALKPAAISRLLASPSSSSSSSSLPSASSTPSGVSISETNSSMTSQSSISTNLGEKAEAAEAEEGSEDEDDDDDEEEEEEAHPLFVTWNTISRGSHEKRLRGCIGTFEALSLSTGLSSYALTSAFDDTRFAPISKRELPSLECAVTLLTDFEPIDDAMDWDVGVHGLRISFSDKGRRYGSTYLPDVAREQGWGKEETLLSLMRKAGWGGRKSEWTAVKMKVVRYQGKKVSLAWDEWKAWREWVADDMADA